MRSSHARATCVKAVSTLGIGKHSRPRRSCESCIQIDQSSAHMPTDVNAVSALAIVKCKRPRALVSELHPRWPIRSTHVHVHVPELHPLWPMINTHVLMSLWPMKRTHGHTHWCHCCIQLGERNARTPMRTDVATAHTSTCTAPSTFPLLSTHVHSN